MITIYLSSTYEDLKDHRKAVFDALRKAGHHVIAMEDYVARDDRPLKACLADVDKADVYVGVFALRYGYIPPKEHGNPDGLSITELEFRRAATTGKPTLVFLLDPNHPWPPANCDSHKHENENGKRIETFRGYLGREKMGSFFNGPDHLASQVQAAVSQLLRALEESQTYQPAKAGVKPPEPVRGWSANELTALIDKIKPVAQVKGFATHAGRAFLVSGWYDDWPEAVADCYGFARDQAGFKKPIPLQPIIDWSGRGTPDQFVKALSDAVDPRAGYPYPIYYILVGYEQHPRADVLAGLLRAWEEVAPGPGQTAHSLFIVLTKNGRPLLPGRWWKRQGITGLPAAVRKRLGQEHADVVLDTLEPVTAAEVQTWPGRLQHVLGEHCPQCIHMNADMISEFATGVPKQGLAHRILGKRLLAKLTTASSSPAKRG
ncbi:MAG: DUF4062 domain-containing protein [Methylococcus sp.]